MRSLERRIETLEVDTLAASDAMEVIHVTFIGDRDGVEPRVIGVKSMAGDWKLSREPGEELAVFYARTKETAPRSRTGLTVILNECVNA